MKENKGVNVCQQPLSSYCSTRSKSFGRYLAGDGERFVRTQDTGCQANARRDSVCTCRMSSSKYQHKARYFNSAPKYIYAYHGVQSNTNIGVSSIRTLNRRRTQRIYLPESPETKDRGIGSADLSSYFIRRPLYDTESYYGSKRTSSKCVGGDIEEPDGIVDEKLSPIVKCCNAFTGSEMLAPNEYDNNNKESNIAEYKHLVPSTPRIDTETPETLDELSDHKDNAAEVQAMPNDGSRVIKPKSKSYISRKAEAKSKLSSDSLIQHVHNLELSSNNKLSQMLGDPMENKLEREYRQMFESKTKQGVFESKTKSSHEKPVRKSTSLLRRRFEALRRGLKKEGIKNDVAVRPSPNSMVSRKDVSVTSDPPSLEARSYYLTRPHTTTNSAPYRNIDTVKHDIDPPMEDDENSYNQGVLSMFRLWSKKINSEENKNATADQSSKAQKAQTNKTQSESKGEKKSESKKFFFFKRRDKNKTNSDKIPYKNKNGTTVNRCKVKDALVHKTPEKSKVHCRKSKVPSKQEVITAKYEEMFCKAWLNKFITNTSESKDSAKIRWNNNTYTSSSSTVFELMDHVYKEAGIVRRSKSDASVIHNYNRPTTKKVNFLQRNVEAWMIPKTIKCSPMMIPLKANNSPIKGDSKNVEVRISKNMWSIDTARTFSRRIELVLHSNNIMKLNDKVSSDFLKIDIPKEFFSDSMNSEERGYRISDEKVFKIVEYETLRSKSDVRKTPLCNTEDRTLNEISLTVSVKDSKNNESKVLDTVIKRPPAQRDVVIQGSRVFFPTRCDVIGVGIITQMKPILKIQEHYSEDDSEPKTFSPKKKCEFAESYLQEYYRQWMPLGIDLYSSCRSNAKLKCSSEGNLVIPLSQGEGCKSCPNIHEEYRTPETMTSSDTSSGSPSCTHFDDEVNSNIFFGKVTKDKDKNQDAKISKNTRMWPKDSTEVFKKRKIYARSNKSKWRDSAEDDDTCGFEEQGATDMCSECPSFSDKTPCCTAPVPKKRRCSIKRVSLQDYDYYDTYKDKIDKTDKTGILAYKGAACETCRRTDVKCSKHSRLDPAPCEIQLHEPPCEFDTPQRKIPPCHQKPQNQTCLSATPSRRRPECEDSCIPIPIPPCLKSVICDESPPKRYQEIIVTKRPCPERSPPCRPSPCPPPNHQSPCPPIAPASFAPLLSTERSDPCMRQRECPQTFPSPPPPSLKFKVRSSTANGRQPCPFSCTNGDTENTAKSKKEQKEKKKNKSEKQVTCDCPPPSSECEKSESAPSPNSDQEYPWPTNNKVSLPPSPEYSKVDQLKKCSIPNEPPKAEKDCKPDCANRRKLYKYVDSGQLPYSDQAHCPPASPPARHTCPASSHAAPPCRGLPTSCPSNPAPTHVPNHPPKCAPPPQSHCPECRSKPASNCYQSNVTAYSSDTALHPYSNTPPANSSPLRSPPQSQPDPHTSLPPQPAPPPSETPGLTTDCPKPCKNYKYKLAGLFQKINTAMKKSCPDDNTAWSNDQKIVRTNVNHECSHSKVKVTRSSNTDKNRSTKHRNVNEPPLREITENKSQHSAHMASVLGSMYDTSSICHRVSTPVALSKSNTEDKACTCSNTDVESVTNVVEIDFTVKVTQGDKINNIAFENDSETEKAKNTKVVKTCSKEVYIVHQTKPSGQGQDAVKNPNDINVHVVIKNLKRKDTPSEQVLIDHPKEHNFFKTVSNKFHTVSTGYSEISRRNVNHTGTETSNIFSVHRATWDLTCSDDKIKTPSKSSEEITNAINNEPDASASRSVATITEKNKTAVDNKPSQSECVSESKIDVDRQDEIDTNTGYTDQYISEASLTHSHEVMSSDSSKAFSNLPIWLGRTKNETIRMLQIALEKAGKMETKDDEKILKILNMLSAIMKSESTDVVNMNITCIEDELLKKLPLHTPNIFTDVNSLNNFYKSSTVLDETDKRDVRHDSSKKLTCESTASLIGCADSGCLCSTLATKLNIPGKGGWCCCRKPLKINIETNCDIRTSEDIFLLDYTTPILLDQATQRSRFMFSRANSLNVSIHNCACEPFVLNNSMSGKELEPKKETKEIDNESSITPSSEESSEAMSEEDKKRQLNRETVLKITEENKLILACLDPTKNIIEKKSEIQIKDTDLPSLGIVTAAEVLQCYETKKAVLEIYAEKTVSDGREHFVAKLPKFARKKEREISEYGEITMNRLQQEALSCR